MRAGEGCKPGSVRRRWAPDGHPSGTPVTRGRKRPTRGSAGTGSTRAPKGLPPYLALHRTRFAVRRRLPASRWALTPPFHPCRDRPGGLLSVARSLRCRNRDLPGVPPCGARTFLPGKAGAAARLPPARRPGARFPSFPLGEGAVVGPYHEPPAYGAGEGPAGLDLHRALGRDVGHAAPAGAPNKAHHGPALARVP